MSDMRPVARAVTAVLPEFPESIAVVDSHTEGEPTRVVLSGWPELRGETMAERRADLLDRFDHLRSAVASEPRGHEAMVGALLTPPTHPDSEAGVIFFNNVGCLGMCGHGLIGVVRTLEFVGRVRPGTVRIDTPVGTVEAVLGEDGSVTIRNVPAHCHARDVALTVPGVGEVTGDVAYGGNWFFITHLADEPVSLARLDPLLDRTRRILRALQEQGIRGADGAVIDHVELSAPPGRGDADCRNFVLCPGGEYDRSPCGTGTSAKMASLHARGELAAGQRWRQEGIAGGVFTGWLEESEAGLVPYIRGHAFVTGTSTLRFDAGDPFRAGLPRA